jgi:hypothetical protein
MNKRIFLGLVFLIIAFVNHATLAGSVTFSDGTFNNDDWYTEIVKYSGPMPSYSAYQATSGGNPGAYRNVQQHFGGDGDIWLGHWFDGATYNPSTQGAITTIDSSFDIILFNGGASETVGYMILLEQNGIVYQAGYTLTTIEPKKNIWVHHAYSDLTADDFLDVHTNTQHPDFSANGDMIELGFISANGTGGSYPTSTSSGIDNWSVSISSVPLPPAILFFVSGLLSILGLKKSARS